MFCTTPNCNNWKEGNTKNCASCNAEQRKKKRDEEKEKHKRSRQQELSKQRDERHRARERNRQAEDRARVKQETSSYENSKPDGSNKHGGEPIWPKGINRRSQKRAAEERRYSKRVKEWKQEHDICQVCHESLTTECHHKLGREGKRLLDERYWLACCTPCHQFIGDNPNFSIREGYSLERTKKYTPPED